MPATYTLIDSEVLTSSAASITFSAIPSTYTDLVIKLSSRIDANAVSLKVNFNSDTTTKYSYTRLYGSGSSAGSDLGSSATYAFPVANNRISYTANVFSNSELYVPNYTSTTSKAFSTFGTTENNATESYIGPTASLYTGTSAITSITLTPDLSANFDSGSSFYLYGISNA